MNTITVQAIINSPIETVWKNWNTPEDIQAWCHASETWECPHAENDLVVGGKFLSRMAAKDGSVSFDFCGIYTEVLPLELIAYKIEDGRTVQITFEKISDNETKVTETFDPETENPAEMQQAGWQAILDNFKTYTESK